LPLLGSRPPGSSLPGNPAIRQTICPNHSAIRSKGRNNNPFAAKEARDARRRNLSPWWPRGPGSRGAPHA
jgi:hypothetical protein